MKTVEFACTANHSRSPVAELIARNYLEDQNEQGITIISSGTRVIEMTQWKETKTPPKDVEKWVVSKALKRGYLYGGNSPQDASRLLSLTEMTQADRTLFQRLAYHAFERFEDEQQKFREEALKKLGIRGTIRLPQQTVVRSEVNLFLGMGKENSKFASEIYQLYQNKPKIDTLKVYATRESETEFTSAYGGNLNDYLTMVEEIRGYTITSLERFLEDKILCGLKRSQ